MNSWAQRRKFLYISAPLIILTSLFVYGFLKYSYHAPSCSNGIQDGTEKGVDCGGTCRLICTGDSVQPLVLWSQAFQASGSVWNAGAYVQNPNISSVATHVPYTFKLYDEKNMLITSVSGQTYIPRYKKFLVFQGGIDTLGKTVKRTEFEFTEPPVWYNAPSADPVLYVVHSPLQGTSSSPVISGVMTNQNSFPVGQVELSVIIYDAKQNAVGISRTFTDALLANGSADFGFTWLQPFKVTTDICTNPSDVMLVLDRSGSMASLAKDPAEPLTTVKKTASEFVSNLSNTSDGNRVGVISFATNPSDPIDHTLSTDLSDVNASIARIAIATSSIQNTNIGDALIRAVQELTSSRENPDAKKILILLTDGEPTDPQKKGDTAFPTTYALSEAASIKQQTNISLFTIGLGLSVNDTFLSQIASSPSQYFKAPTSKELKGIYRTISTTICTRKPNVIELIATPVLN